MIWREVKEERQVTWGQVMWQHYIKVGKIMVTLGTVPNAPLAYYLGREYPLPILGMLGTHGVHVKREIERVI